MSVLSACEQQAMPSGPVIHFKAGADGGVSDMSVVQLSRAMAGIGYVVFRMTDQNKTTDCLLKLSFGSLRHGAIWMCGSNDPLGVALAFDQDWLDWTQGGQTFVICKCAPQTQDDINTLGQILEGAPQDGDFTFIRVTAHADGLFAVLDASCCGPNSGSAFLHRFKDQFLREEGPGIWTDH